MGEIPSSCSCDSDSIIEGDSSRGERRFVLVTMKNCAVFFYLFNVRTLAELSMNCLLCMNYEYFAHL